MNRETESAHHDIVAQPTEVQPAEVRSSESQRIENYSAAFRWLPLATGLFAFLLYAFNLSSTVTYGGDSGELIAASYRLGIAHPTGYVLYALLARIFASLVPFGEIAWRYNIFSALCGALCVGVLTRLMLEIFARHALQNRTVEDRVLDVAGDAPKSVAADWPILFAACGASALLAGFYFFFSQSVLAEVYSLNALMLSLLLYCAWKWHDSFATSRIATSSTRSLEQSPDWRWLWTLGLLFGLSLNAHMSCAFALPALVLWCVWHHRNAFRGRAWSRLSVLVFWTLCGFALTVYLPLRASLFPAPDGNLWWPLDWTHPTDFASWYTHIRAKQYEFLFLQPTNVELFGHTTTIKWFVQPFSAIAPKLASLIGLLLVQWLWCLFLVPVGAFVAWKRDRALGGALLWIFIVNFAVQINYNVGVGELANFLFPAYLVMTLWIGFGLHVLLGFLQQWSVRRDALNTINLLQKSILSEPRPEGNTKTVISVIFARGLILNAASNATSSTRSVQNTVWSWRVRTLSFLVLAATCALQLMFSVPASSTRGNVAAREAAHERATATEHLQSQTRRKVQLWMSSDDATWSFWYAQFVQNRARSVETPWGTNWRAKLADKGALSFATQAMSRGELAMSYYQSDVDARLPFVPFDEKISPRGLVWRASRRKLPLSALPLRKAISPARALSDDKNANIEYSMSDKKALRVAFPIAAMKNGVAHLKRENLTRMTLDFRTSWTKPILNSPLEIADSPPSVQVGWVQILTARRGLKVTSQISQSVYAPLPTPQNLSPIAQARRPRTPQVSVQTLRLVVPQNVRQNQILRAVLPMQIDVDGTGEYDIWLRLVRDRDDKTATWQRATTINITAS